MLREHSRIFWLDASVRFTTGDLSGVVQQATSSRSDIILFDFSGHPIFPATHTAMFRYLPIGESDAVKTDMYGAGVVYHQCSKQVTRENGRDITVTVTGNDMTVTSLIGIRLV